MAVPTMESAALEDAEQAIFIPLRDFLLGAFNVTDDKFQVLYNLDLGVNESTLSELWEQQHVDGKEVVYAPFALLCNFMLEKAKTLLGNETKFPLSVIASSDHPMVETGYRDDSMESIPRKPDVAVVFRQPSAVPRKLVEKMRIDALEQGFKLPCEPPSQFPDPETSEEAPSICWSDIGLFFEFRARPPKNSQEPVDASEPARVPSLQSVSMASVSESEDNTSESEASASESDVIDATSEPKSFEPPITKQMSLYASECIRKTFLRSFTFGASIEQTMLQLWYFDPAGAVVSKHVDMKTADGFRQFQVFLLALTTLDEVQWVGTHF